MQAGFEGDGWRWDPGNHRYWSGRPTITVSEPSEDQKEEHRRKVETGAQVVPFGFSRVLVERAEEPERDLADDAWEGQGL